MNVPNSSTGTFASTSKLLQLPLELRQRIFELYFENTTISVHPATVVVEASRARKMQPLHNLPTHYHHRQLNPDLALLTVNRQLHHEASAAFYRTATFHIDIMVSRPYVPVASLYRMRRVFGGAEINQLLEQGDYAHSTRKKHSIIGPFEPAKLQVRDLDVETWVSDPILGFMVDEANRENQRSIGMDMYLSVYSQWVF